MKRLTFIFLLLLTGTFFYAQDAREAYYYYEVLELRHEPKPETEGFVTERITEYLNRGLYATRTQDGNGIFLSWRLLQSDDPQTGFHIYREVNGKARRLNRSLITATCDFIDPQPAEGTAYYWIVSIVKGKAQPASDKIEVVFLQIPTKTIQLLN